VRGERVNYKRLTLLVFLTCWTVALSARSQETSSLAPGEKPADAPPQWKEWIGEYGPDNFIYSVRESHASGFPAAAVANGNSHMLPLGDMSKQNQRMECLLP